MDPFLSQRPTLGQEIMIMYQRYVIDPFLSQRPTLGQEINSLDFLISAFRYCCANFGPLYS